MKGKSKKGISLIVLVITIIIIIILAGAVILNLSNNNPSEGARRASLHQTRDSLRSGANLYTVKVVATTNGAYRSSDMILGKTSNVEQYSIVVDYDVSTVITKNGSDLELWQLDYDEVSAKVGVKLQNIDAHSKWYIDEYGNPYLMYDALENVAGYLKG